MTLSSLSLLCCRAYLNSLLHCCTVLGGFYSVLSSAQSALQTDGRFLPTLSPLVFEQEWTQAHQHTTAELLTCVATSRSSSSNQAVQYSTTQWQPLVYTDHQFGYQQAYGETAVVLQQQVYGLVCPLEHSCSISGGIFTCQVLPSLL